MQKSGCRRGGTKVASVLPAILRLPNDPTVRRDRERFGRVDDAMVLRFHELTALYELVHRLDDATATECRCGPASGRLASCQNPDPGSGRNRHRIRDHAEATLAPLAPLRLKIHRRVQGKV
jgi:hypothetical protein